jgi:hypothetical protein
VEVIYHWIEPMGLRLRWGKMASKSKWWLRKSKAPPKVGSAKWSALVR